MDARRGGDGRDNARGGPRCPGHRGDRRQPYKKDRLAGVGVFSVPMNQKVVPAYFAGLAPLLLTEAKSAFDLLNPSA